MPPWSYQIDEAGRLVRFRIYGQINDLDLLNADSQLRQAEKFTPDLDELVDMRDAVEGDLTAAAIRELASRPPLFSTASRRAFVVHGDLGYGLIRMFQGRRGDVAGEIQIFRNLADAEFWLSEAGPSEG